MFITKASNIVKGSWKNNFNDLYTGTNRPPYRCFSQGTTDAIFFFIILVILPSYSHVIFSPIWSGWCSMVWCFRNVRLGEYFSEFSKEKIGLRTWRYQRWVPEEWQTCGSNLRFAGKWNKPAIVHCRFIT